MRLTKTKARKGIPRPAPAAEAELVFVVDVSAFTEKGFVGSTAYQGEKLDLEFDEAGEGVFLTSEMAERLHARKGSKLSLTFDDGAIQAAELAVSGITVRPRISDPKVYYSVGREGGAVMRIRKA